MRVQVRKVLLPVGLTLVLGCALTDSQIRGRLIRKSHAGFGPCPCPYSQSRGSFCGKGSVYSQSGGTMPFCYPNDVEDWMVEAYRRQVQ